MVARVEVKSRAEWRQWLEENHDRGDGIWLVTYKRNAAPKWFLSYDDIVEEAICFGWIDSLPKKLDDARSMRRLAPRRPKSAWSDVNKARVAKLMAAGQLARPGLVVIERAKRDGSWSKLSEVEKGVIPPDLLRAFEKYPRSKEHFDAFPRSSRRLILEWIGSAKGEDTRARRIEETARLAAHNLRANHWRQPASSGAREPAKRRRADAPREARGKRR